jgi:hypothetical protein
MSMQVLEAVGAGRGGFLVLVESGSTIVKGDNAPASRSITR